MHELINKKILLGMTGGIAAYKSAELARRLREVGAEVKVELFDDPDHSIREKEINWVNQKIFL